MSFTISQINHLLRGKPAYQVCSSVGTIAVPTEILEGDTVFFTDSTTTGGYPTPVVTTSVLLNGVAQTLPFTVPGGAAGQSLMYQRVLNNGISSTVTNSNVATIAAPQGFADMGFIGGNVEATTDYATSPLFRNALYDGRGWGWSGQYGTTPLSGGNGSGSATMGGTMSLVLISGLSYTLTLTSYTASALMGNSNDVGRVFTITSGGVVLTATVTAAGTSSGSATTTPNANTSNCTVTLSATPTVLTGLITWSIPLALDANGWPLQKCELVVTSSPGQLPGGVTYQMTVKSKNPALTVSGVGLSAWNAGHPTPTGLMNFPGVLDSGTGITTYTFNITFPVVNGLILEFSDGITFADIPRDGSATSIDGGSPFNQQALAHYSKFSTLRFMDFLNTNGKKETDWSTRTLYTQFPTRPFSWETAIDFCNALYEYPGSKVKQVWLNIGGLCTVAPGNAHSGLSYAEHLPQLANTWNSGLYAYSGINSNLKVIWEYGNEPWNFAFNLWGQYLIYAGNELQMLTTPGYGGAMPTVTGLTVSGSTVTVNCSGAKPSWVVNGATMLCASDANYWMGLDGSASLANLSSLAPIANVTTGVDGNSNPIYSFTYQTAGTNGATTFAGTARFSMIFNTTSTLVQDQQLAAPALQQQGCNTYYYSTLKWMVRQAWRIKQILINGGIGGATRPNDRMILNLQQYGGGGFGGNNSSPQHFAYGQWLDSAGNAENTSPNATPSMGNWLYGVAIAPYVTANANGNWTGGSANITGLKTFAAYAVGDTMAVNSGNTPKVVQAGVTVVTAYLSSTVTGINGNAVTLADSAVASTALTTGNNVMVMAKTGGSGATVGAVGVGVMYAGDNVVNFTTPITGLTVGDTVAVSGTGMYPFSSTVLAVKAVSATSTSGTTGTGYTAGTYLTVPLNGGTGTGAIAKIVMAGGGIQSYSMVARGSGYSANDVLTFLASNVGGTGSGGSIKVVSIATILQDAPYAAYGTGAILAPGFSITAAGSGYTDGTYTAVALTNVSSAGAGATANITVTGGVITAVTLGSAGTSYLVGDVLSASASTLGSGGTGFQITVLAANVVYATATSGAAVGLKSRCMVNANNTFVYNLSLAGLAPGDTVAIAGVGNPSLYAKVTSIDGVNSILTLDHPVQPQQTLASGILTPLTTNGTVIMTGVNPASVVKAMMINLKFTDDTVRAHVTQCRLAGVRPIAYEAGPDTQCIPLWQKEIHTYSDATYGMDAFVRALCDIWFQNGGEHFHYFTAGPSAFTDGTLIQDINGNVIPGNVGAVAPGVYLSQSLWSICQSYTDTTAPKMAALMGYNTPKWYQNAMTYPLVPLSTITPIPNARLNQYNFGTPTAATYQRIDFIGSTASTVTTALTTAGWVGVSMLSWNSVVPDRLVTFLVPVPRGGKYFPVVWGTDNVTGTQVQLLVDKVNVGSQTLPVNGKGNVATTVPGPATGAVAMTLASGMHLMQVLIPAGTGTINTGLWTINLVLTT